MSRIGALVVLLISLTPTFATGVSEGSFGIRRFVAPDYPNLARLAQISGDVRLLAEVSDDGRVGSATVLAGPPILATSAQKNVLTWQFTKRPPEGKLEIIYHYRLHEPKVYGQVVPSVSLESPTEVVITSNFPLPT